MNDKCCYLDRDHDCILRLPWYCQSMLRRQKVGRDQYILSHGSFHRAHSFQCILSMMPKFPTDHRLKCKRSKRVLWGRICIFTKNIRNNTFVLDKKSMMIVITWTGIWIAFGSFPVSARAAIFITVSYGNRTITLS